MRLGACEHGGTSRSPGRLVTEMFGYNPGAGRGGRAGVRGMDAHLATDTEEAG